MRSIFRGISVVIIVMFICSINIKSLVTINYFINQSEIIELFCINKDKPQLECNGKCHLATQLITIDENQEEKPFFPSGNLVNWDLQYVIVNTDIKLSQGDYIEREYATDFRFSNIAKGHFSILSPPPQLFNIV